jgi:REP element-mobilizing transposase RayT
MGHPPRIPVWLPWEQDVIYFVTICVSARRPVLANAASFAAFKTVAGGIRNWRVAAAVVMPDHAHFLVAPRERDLTVGDFSNAVKRLWRRKLTTRQGASGMSRWEWQPGCFDRLLRSDESASRKWEYIRENPVRAGLVACWEQWPFSIGFRGDPSAVAAS